MCSCESFKLYRINLITLIHLGGVLSAKAQADEQLHQARHKVKEVVHALHKAQDLTTVQAVSILYNELIYSSLSL